MDFPLFYNETICSHKGKSALSKNTILFFKRGRYDDRWHFPCCNKNTSPYATGGATKKFSSVQWVSHVWLFVTPWTVACQVSLSITNSQSLLKLMYIMSEMPSNHLILCHPLLLPSSILPSIRVFSNESVLHLGGQSIGISVLGLVFLLGLTGWISLHSKWLSRVFSNITVQKLQFFGTQLSSQSNSHIRTWPLEKP